MNTFRELHYKNPALSLTEVEGLFYILANTPSVTSSQLISLTGVPKETLRVFKTTIKDLLVQTQEDKLSLNELGRNLCATTAPAQYNWSLLDYHDAELEAKILQLRQAVTLTPRRDLDQFFATAQTSAAKALILKAKGLLTNGGRVALLGDDDLVSLTLALLNRELELVVFDIDPEILSAVNEGAKMAGAKNVKTVLYDARDIPNKQYLDYFDVVLTDPPYTKFGFALFLRRAVEFTGYDFHKGLSKHIFIHFGASFKTPEKFLKIQEIIGRFGLVQEDVIAKFARYTGAESIGNASSLYILRTTPHTAVISTAPSGKIYTFESDKEEKFPYVDHFVFKLNKVPQRLLDSKKQLQKIAGEFCTIHKLNVVQTQLYKFKPYGYSLTYILSNSNLIVHTWPEHQAVHIDLISCSPIYNKHTMPETLARLFETVSIEVIQEE
ncbi:TPA: hypothetical protein DCY43_03605 [candidate division WWE3 bacterium]|uniref:N(4)-bis(aminopropyl)spermidine synthase C-terminal domain-containing protein n=4 Tax=Katanobacteria TaxID=422282 RepID=A0A0G1KN25_UNCKA|nr:MAG: hypothetical protein UW65_C0012G0001 [candidate division WWE3 bacterium GW2011_GWB1_44_4]KKT84890.1 MAG: hypothetical protein UW82_C0007G0006 [candidate division WWE3 bacterium GW2011_GWC2_44_9]OGC52698.1 MAG: hypothetical protein A2709_00940 [candidate division WWE3 bacterium RIFCSPHIGHO2_01_FULL_43_9]HAZ29796.1 hypothetical protein [candidate division WWE3 bacterium]